MPRACLLPRARPASPSVPRLVLLLEAGEVREARAVRERRARAVRREMRWGEKTCERLG